MTTKDDLDRWFESLDAESIPVANPTAADLDQFSDAEAQSAPRDWAESLDSVWGRAVLAQNRARAATRERRHRIVRWALPAGAVVVVAGVVALMVPGGDGNDSTFASLAPVVSGTAQSPALPPAASSSAAAEVPANTNCLAVHDGALVKGAGAGGAGSGADAVLAFQYAYYVTRSGVQARAVVAPDAAVPAAPDIQAGIDTIPPGTTHCLAIVAIATDRYSVELTEHRPDGATTVYKQTVTTAPRDGHIVITGITGQ